MIYNSNSLTHWAATVSRAIGIEPPKMAEPGLDWVNEVLENLCKEGFDRVMIHNPDAVGEWLYEQYPDAFTPVLKHTQLTIPFKSPMPSVTPVCFGTMYTGVPPAVHGIQEYAKPVIPVDTFFEAALRAGKKVAVLATQNCSMNMIFLGKGHDVYICSTEAEILEKAHELIVKDCYDILCVYTWMFDTNDHRYGPKAPEALESLYQQGQYFDQLATWVEENWKQHNTLIGFAPDHGVHKAPEGTLNSKGKPIQGHHASDTPLDLNILHYFGVKLREKTIDPYFDPKKGPYEEQIG